MFPKNKAGQRALLALLFAATLALATAFTVFADDDFPPQEWDVQRWGEIPNPDELLYQAAIPTFTILTQVEYPALIQFLDQDLTNWQAYSERRSFRCLEFSKMLVARARESGIAARIIGVKFEGAEVGHAFVEFLTPRGRIWVEPQNDWQYSFKVFDQTQRLCLVTNTSHCWPGTVERTIEMH